jgi:hypothetical protein
MTEGGIHTPAYTPELPSAFGRFVSELGDITVVNQYFLKADSTSFANFGRTALLVHEFGRKFADQKETGTGSKYDVQRWDKVIEYLGTLYDKNH